MLLLQAAAVTGLLHGSAPVGLVQGPPGTGKTTTLLGLMAGAYAQIKQQQRLGRAFERITATPAAAAAAAAAEHGRKKILVCAPSNAAVDEVAERIIESGLVDPYTGQNVHPVCLRIGNSNLSTPNP